MDVNAGYGSAACRLRQERAVGGRSGNIGIKAMFHHKVQGLTVLDDTFEPRFEVTLAKAGDSSQSGYFTGTPGLRRGSTGITRRTAPVTGSSTTIPPLRRRGEPGNVLMNSSSWEM